MAELAVLDKAKVLPSEYTELEYIQSNDNHPRIEVDSIKNIAENEIEFQTQIMWVGSSVNNGGTLEIGFGSSSYNAIRTFGVTYDGYWKTNQTKITPNKKASTNVLYDISYKMYSNKVILEVKNGDTTEVNSTVNYNIPFDGNSIFYPTDYIGYGLRSARIYFSKVYRDGVLVFNGMPAKRNSDNAVGLYDTISNTFYKQIASQSSSGYNFIAGPEILPEYSSVIPVVLVGTDTGHSNKKYDLYDRVYDDTGKDIGMVSGFQLDQEDNEYAVVCLNAEYRIFGDILSGNDNVTVGKCWGYNSVMEITETGTEETQNIIEFITANSSYTSSGAIHARSKTFVIDGVTYQAQLPNFPEALKISSNIKRINEEDPSDSTYSSRLLPIATTTSTASEQMYALFGSATWYQANNEGIVASANNIYQIKPLGMSDASNRSQTANKLIVPILELPNPEL